MLRDSVLYQGSLVLSYKDTDEVKHAILHVTDEGQLRFHKERQIFHTVVQAVDFYLQRASSSKLSFIPTPIDCVARNQPKQNNDDSARDHQLYEEDHDEPTYQTMDQLKIFAVIGQKSPH